MVRWLEIIRRRHKTSGATVDLFHTEMSTMTTKDRVKTLMRKKDDIESQIKQFGEVLESQRNVGLHQPLVDGEGYPRLDVDIYQVRHARQKIICLQNDHKAVMKEIEECLHQLHAEEKGNGSKELSTTDEEMLEVDVIESLTPIARVDVVMKNSPAEQAGLLAGDSVIKFGSITSLNFNNLQDISRVVQHSVGRSLHLTILRNNKREQLILIPNMWSGRGLLGCNLLPA